MAIKLANNKKLCFTYFLFPFLFILSVLVIDTTLAQQKIQFVDVTSEAGIHFKHTDGRSGQKYLLETLGSGAVFFDYDNDGDIDLYVVNGADLPGFISPVAPTNVLYRNNGNATFTDVTAQAGVGHTGYGMGCAAADYDNDGYQDLYVANYGQNVLYHNNGDGTFTDLYFFANTAMLPSVTDDWRTHPRPLPRGELFAGLTEQPKK